MWSGGEESLVEVKEDGFGNCLTTGDREREREREGPGSRSRATPWLGRRAWWAAEPQRQREVSRFLSLAVRQRHVPSAPWGLQMHTGPPEDTANRAPVKSLKLTQQLI